MPNSHRDTDSGKAENVTKKRIPYHQPTDLGSSRKETISEKFVTMYERYAQIGDWWLVMK